MPGKTTDESRDYRPGHADAYDAAAALEPLFIEFLEDSAAVINARTEFKYRADFARFSQWLSLEGIPATLAALERRVLNKYVAWLKSRPAPTGRNGTLSNHTIDSYIRTLRTFARYLVGDGRFPRDPFYGPRAPRPHLGQRIQRAAAADDVALLERGTAGTEPLSLRDRAVLTIVLDAGLRTGEFIRLNLEDVALDGGYLEIHESKWNNSRVVPIGKPVVVALRRYLRWGRPKLTGIALDDAPAADPLLVGRTGVRLTENGLYQAVRRAYRRGGGKGSLGLHAFRRLFAAHTQDEGVDQRVTQDNMGHEDARVTKLYAGATRITTARAALSGKTPLTLMRTRGRH